METLSIVPVGTDVDPCSSRVPASTASLRPSYVPRKYLILTRLSADVLADRINYMYEEETLGPHALGPAFMPIYDGETEIWFDWAFVDFWRANNRESCLVAPSILL